MPRRGSGFATAVIFGGETAAAVSGFLFAIVAARSAGLREYGYFGFVLAIAATVLLVLDIRLEDIVARRAQQGLDERGDASWSNYVWGDALFGVVRFAGLAGAVLLIPGLRSSALSPLFVVVIAASLVGTADSSLVAVLNIIGRRRPIAVARAAPGAARLVLVIVVQPRTAMGLAIIHVVGAVVATALLWATVRPLLRGPRGVLTFLGSWREWRGEVVTLSIASTIRAPAAYVDQLVVGILLGATNAGVYRLARSLASLPGVLTASLRFVHLPPILSAAGRADAEELRRLLARLTAGSLAIGALTITAWTAFGRLFLTRMLGEEFVPVYGPAAVLFFGACAEYATSWSKILPVAVRRPRWTFIESVGYVTVLPAATYIGARMGGVLGTAVAVALVSLVASVGWLVVLRCLVGAALTPSARTKPPQFCR